MPVVALRTCVRMIPRRSDGTSRSSCSSGRSPSWRPTSTPRRAAGSASSPSSTAARAGPTGAAAPAPTGSPGAAGSRPSPRASTCASRGGSSRSRSCGPRSRTGRLSYSKVRALTRVEEVEREEDLLSLAEHATAAQLERLVRAYRGVVAVERSEPERWVAWSHDADGSLLLRARLPAEEGALVVAALEAAREAAWERVEPERALPRKRPRREDASAEAPVDSETLPRKRRRRAVRRSRTRSCSWPTRCSPPALPRAPAATGTRWWCTSMPPCWRATPGAAGCCELADGTPLAPETARRLACDASIVALTERGGRTLDVGRKTRSIPPALRRALAARDRGCRFPGCDRARVRRPPHPSLGARRRHEPRQPGAPVPPPPRARPRGRLHGRAAPRRRDPIPPPRRAPDRALSAAPPGRVAAMRTRADRSRRLRAALHRADGPGLRGRRDAGDRPARHGHRTPRGRDGVLEGRSRSEIVRVTAAVPSAGTSVTRTLIRSVRDRWRLSAARDLRVSLTLSFSRDGAVAVRRPVPVDVVRRPTFSRSRGRGVDGGLRAQPPGLVGAREQRDDARAGGGAGSSSCCGSASARSRGVGVGVGVTVGVAVGVAVGVGRRRRDHGRLALDRREPQSVVVGAPGRRRAVVVDESGPRRPRRCVA